MEKCYDPRDKTLRFVEREDELDFLCEGFNSPTALMSCGHAVTPMSLTNWCRRLLDQGKSTFVCGQGGCDIEWPYSEVRKMALLTQEEMEYFEKAMAFNSTKNVKLCPGCKSSVMRKDESNLNVRCTMCRLTKGINYEFCWQCLRQWKGRAPRSDRCDNDGCYNEPLKLLQTCPVIVFESVKNVTGCPSIRACPKCGLLVEHTQKYCKNVSCPRCKLLFCFVCLEPKACTTYYSACAKGVAPRQTSIPERKTN